MTIEQVLKHLNIEYRMVGQDHHARPGWAQVRCPFCNSGAFHLGINLSAGYTSCWVCGRHNLHEALEMISGVYCKNLLGDLEKYKPVEKPPGKLVIPKGVCELLPPQIRYLKNRGFDPDETVALWEIAGIGITGTHRRIALRWRIFIPIMYQGEMVSWTTRSILPGALKRYITAGADEEKLPAKTLLFGEDYVRHAVIACEGAFDAMKIGPGAIATMGISYTRAQVEKLSKYPIRVICFDSEQAAQRRAAALCSQLEVFDGCTYNVALNAKDAASATPREIKALRRRFLT